MRAASFFSSLFCVALLAGCANLAPDYARPQLPVPATIDGAGAAAAQALGDLEWRRVITDERLKNTVELALANNRDLRIAVLNIEKARAQYRIESAALFPAIDATADGNSARSEGTVTRKYSVGVGVTAYELDLFGRIATLREAALQSYLSTAATQRSVRASLIAEVANAWLTLAANQDLLKLARETLASRTTTLELTRRQ